MINKLALYVNYTFKYFVKTAWIRVVFTLVNVCTETPRIVPWRFVRLTINFGYKEKVML